MSLFKQFYYEQASPENNVDKIKKAIENRNVIYFYYEGDIFNGKGYRWVEPVAFGYTNEGNGLLRAFQLRNNPSKSKNKPMWRLFSLNKISDVSISLRKFNRPRKGYNKNGDKGISNLEINAKF